MRRRRVEEARDAFEKSLAIDPNDPWNYLYMGHCYDAQGDLLVAIDQFSRAAELMPGQSIAYLCLGDAHAALGQVELADSSFRRAIEVEPTNKLTRGRLRSWEERLLEGTT